MTVQFITLGCKVNQYESQAMLEALEAQGFHRAKRGEPADVVVVNSCTVTAVSDQKVRQALRRARRSNPDAVTVLTGCMPQAFPKEAEALNEADIVLGTTQRSALLSHILSYLSSRQRIVDIAPHQEKAAFEPLKIQRFQEHTRAFVKIQDGCNRFCSYCIIPYARGRVRSKPLSDIQEETAQLAAHGYREVVLTGINLSAYGQDFREALPSSSLSLFSAIEAVCAQPKITRVRLGSLEPEQLSDETIARLAGLKKLCPQFHLSLQSGCNTTLARMNRHYTTEEYRRIASSLRKAFPGAAITTDVMVGFPGETQEEFQVSLSFVKEMAFAKAHVFAYSRRPGTKAFDLPNQCSQKEKEARSRQMIACTDQSRQAFYETMLHTQALVLFERETDKNLYEGHTPNYTPVLAVSPLPLQGQTLPVTLTSVQGDHCVGQL